MAEKEEIAERFTQVAAQEALVRMSTMIGEYSRYYEKKTRSVFWARGVLTILHLVSLSTLCVLILLQPSIAVSGLILSILSIVALVSFSLLQVVYPDRVLEAYRRVLRDLSDLRLKLSFAELETDPQEMVQLAADAQKQVSNILFRSSLFPGDNLELMPIRKTGAG